jgi:hypothetical protein
MNLFEIETLMKERRRELDEELRRIYLARVFDNPDSGFLKEFVLKFGRLLPALGNYLKKRYPPFFKTASDDSCVSSAGPVLKRTGTGSPTCTPPGPQEGATGFPEYRIDRGDCNYGNRGMAVVPLDRSVCRLSRYPDFDCDKKNQEAPFSRSPGDC